MRDAYRVGQIGTFGFGAEFDTEASEKADSRDQVALVWTESGEVVSATPIADSGQGKFGIDLMRFPSEYDLGASINLHRTRKLGLPAISYGTRFLTIIADHSERTKILALDGEKQAFEDAILLEWLVNAERQVLLGTDGHPVFETSLEETACSIRRLPNGQISMTEAPRHAVDALGMRLRGLPGGYGPTAPNICVETPLRCAARYFLTVMPEGAENLRQGKSSDAIAFLLMNSSGYSFGLWSTKAGLFSENAFLAPDAVNPRARKSRRESVGNPQQELEVIRDKRTTEEYIRKAFEQLLLHMSPEKLESLQLSNYSQIVWGAESGLVQSIAPIAAEFETRTGLNYVPLRVPADEAIARGLLLGSHSFSSESVVGAANVPPVNLARDILFLANTEDIARRREEEVRLQGRRNRVVTTMLAPPVIVGALLFALVAGLIVSGFFLTVREAQADAKTQELKPAVDRRKSYEANLKWYQEFIREVSLLRRQQPVGIGLLYQLNSNYPFAVDPSFYVSDLKLNSNGDLEMKGLARNKDAVASFLKALEFAGGPESGSRLFSNLAYEVQEIGMPGTQAQVKLPTIPGSTLGGSNAVAPGVVIWSIKGNYLPVAGFNPKPAVNQPVPGAQPPAAAPAKPPA
jgi:Tfp pilus assembly protein PilN